eukprot:scaffold18014_cov96-Skeletonema_marinoi.AAC.5
MITTSPPSGMVSLNRYPTMTDDEAPTVRHVGQLAIPTTVEIFGTNNMQQASEERSDWRRN